MQVFFLTVKKKVCTLAQFTTNCAFTLGQDSSLDMRDMLAATRLVFPQVKLYSIQTEACMICKTARGRQQTDDLKRFYASKSCRASACNYRPSPCYIAVLMSALQPSLHVTTSTMRTAYPGSNITRHAGLLQFLDPQSDHNSMVRHRTAPKCHWTCSTCT